MQPDKKRLKGVILAYCFYKKRNINDNELRGGKE